MKKALSLVLAIAMMATLATTAFAAVPSESITGNTTGDVTVSVAVNPTADKDTAVYSVTIEWEADLTFTYIAGQKLQWNPETHKYDVAQNAEQATWTAAKKVVTIKNDSNKAIWYKAEVDQPDDTKLAGVTVSADVTNLTEIVAAAETEEGQPKTDTPSGEVKITVAGDPNNIETVSDTATVTLTIADAAA